MTKLRYFYKNFKSKCNMIVVKGLITLALMLIGLEAYSQSTVKGNIDKNYVIEGKIISAQSGNAMVGEQIKVYIPDYGYIGGAISHEDGSFKVDFSEFPDADRIILNLVSGSDKSGYICLNSPVGSKNSEMVDVIEGGFKVDDVSKYSDYGKLMSMMPGVTVVEDVARLGSEPVQIYVDGYLWPLSYDKNKAVERVDKKPEMPLETSPFKDVRPYKIVVNPSNPVLYSDFRGDNMRTLTALPESNFVRYNLSVLNDFCPIGLVGSATFISPEELMDKYGFKSDSAIVMLWTDTRNADKASSVIIGLK